MCNEELTIYHMKWLCEKGHKTCHPCYGSRWYFEEKRTCSFCSAKGLQAVKPPHGDNNHVFIFVDDSNIWIGAKKLAADKMNLKCEEDPRLRLDIGKVTDVVADDRKVAWGVLYGSEPPPIDSVWQKIRKCGLKVNVTKRSTFTEREKQVDQQMVTDITKLVSSNIFKGKIMMVSGDADMIPAVNESLRKKWSTEIWMWKNGISKSLTKLAEENPGLLTIHTLDLYLEEITFTSFTTSRREIPATRSIIIKDVDFTPDENWQKKLVQELRWPFLIWEGPEKLQNPVDFKYVILIFANAKARDKKDFEIYHFEKIFGDLDRKYPGKISNYPAYRRQFDQQEEIGLTNKFEALQSLDEQLSKESLSAEDVPSSYEAIEEPDEDEEKEQFQVVRRKQQKKTQKYSALCEWRSNCKRGLKCHYHHTDDEKKFFRNFRKNKECPYKGACRYGPSKCSYAHSDENSFCCKCNSWGHLEKNCLTP